MKTRKMMQRILDIQRVTYKYMCRYYGVSNVKDFSTEKCEKFERMGFIFILKERQLK